MTSPTQLSIKYLRDNGWQICISSWWNGFAKKRTDLWGFADIEGFHPDYVGVTYFQITSYSNISARKKKILANEHAKGLLEAGNRIVIHGWIGKGKQAKFRKVIITLEDFDES